MAYAEDMYMDEDMGAMLTCDGMAGQFRMAGFNNVMDNRGFRLDPATANVFTFADADNLIFSDGTEFTGIGKTDNVGHAGRFSRQCR